MKERKVMMAVMAAAFVLGIITPVTAQAAEAEIIVVNRTGAAIKEFIIAPSIERYPENSSCFSADGLKESDGAVFGVTLPGDMREIEFFDIEVFSGGKRYATQMGLRIDFKNGKKPTLELYATEKDLSEELGRAIPLASSVLFFTAKSVIPKKAAALILSRVGVMAASRLGFAAIPKIGFFLTLGLIVADGVSSVVDYVKGPSPLHAQVYYY